MVLPGHLAGGFLAARAALSLIDPSLSAPQTNALLIVGTLAGELPDIDLFFFYLAWRPGHTHRVKNHRDYITHAPLAWLLICAIISVVGWLFGSIFIEYLGAIILTGTWSHFILDSIEYGVHWLWPFSNKRFCLREIPEAPLHGQPGTFKYYFDFLTRFYFKNISCYLEIVVTVVALWIALK